MPIPSRDSVPLTTLGSPSIEPSIIPGGVEFGCDTWILPRTSVEGSHEDTTNRWLPVTADDIHVEGIECVLVHRSWPFSVQRQTEKIFYHVLSIGTDCALVFHCSRQKKIIRLYSTFWISLKEVAANLCRGSVREVSHSRRSFLNRKRSHLVRFLRVCIRRSNRFSMNTLSALVNRSGMRVTLVSLGESWEKLGTSSSNRRCTWTSSIREICHQ